IWRTYVCSRSTAGAGPSVRSSSSAWSGESNAGCGLPGTGVAESSFEGAGVTGMWLSFRGPAGRFDLSPSIGFRGPSLEGDDGVSDAWGRWGRLADGRVCVSTLGG